MERIFNPGVLTIPQRMVFGEIEILKAGKEVVAPLHIRLHHILEYGHAANHFYISSGKDRPPWEYEDMGMFLDVANQVSMSRARRLRKHYEESLAHEELKGDLDDIYYLEDLIGRGFGERDGFEISTYLWCLNLLLRAYRDRDQIVIFDESPDSICTSCRGGRGDQGIGTHCREIVSDPRRNSDRIMLRALMQMPSGNTSMEFTFGANIIVTLPIEKIFDISFMNALDRRYLQLRAYL